MASAVSRHHQNSDTRETPGLESAHLELGAADRFCCGVKHPAAFCSMHATRSESHSSLLSVSGLEALHTELRGNTRSLAESLTHKFLSGTEYLGFGCDSKPG
ncbi:hypothetical protein RRG08_011592 [Elysia crispata]|uniref:Uncharacterized protein n=1 Tax=Elysia crispata TaxID=231223 RepID=A0AAE0XPE5_9GAST|nr:hypothetical protein RRG08_011592 [Elysia crispata]